MGVTGSSSATGLVHGETEAPEETRAAPAVSVHDLVVERGGNRIFDHFDVTVPAGAVTGLLGPSGSGKTTLLRAIVGTQRIRRGTIAVLGEPAGTTALRRRVGYTTQAPSIYGDLTVIDNVRYFATVYGVPQRSSHATVAEVGLGGHSGQLAGTLSGGERARLSLACALVAGPELLILDEPTVGLDPVLRADLWTHFHDLADRGVTLVISSHVMDEAGRCDRLLLLREGRLIADDTPAAIRDTTGVHDLEEAFLRLIAADDAVPALR